jgi:molybdopterin converting factor small subunit
MLCLYFAWFTDQLGTKDVQKMLPQKTNRELSEMIWAERYQKPKETREDFLINLQK